MPNNQQQNQEQLSKRVGRFLTVKGWKLTTVESCTGGMVAEIVTAVPGSSEYFEGGFVTYSNEAKINLVGVAPETIAKYGAVSEETAREMVAGALQRCSAQVALAITGIAGPAGGSVAKPVGTVYFAWQCRDREVRTSCRHFSGGRNDIRLAAACYALAEVLELA